MILFYLLIFKVFAIEYDLFTSEYPKGAFCAAIGGACAGDPDFDHGFFQNPAALTSQDEFWDFDFDFSTSNSLENGITGNNRVSQDTGLGALAFSNGKFGYGISYTEDNISVSQTSNLQTTAHNYFLSIPLSYALSKKIHIGVALTGFLHTETLMSSADSGQIHAQQDPSIGFTFGGLYLHNSVLSFGSWFRTPLDSHVDRTLQSPSYMDQIGVHLPWIFALGAGYRPFEDQTSFTFDLNLIGQTSGGMAPSYDTIVHIPKGRDLVVDPRLGFKTPWFKDSKGTLLLGCYYANSRTEGFKGAVHGTAGVAYRVLIPWVDSLEFMAAVDLAQDYSKVFLTFR